MKYAVLIIDGAAGHPLPEYKGKTCLELARTPNLDALVREGQLGLTCNVPEGMEPGSAVACMSILGYDPKIYYQGRSAIEALSMGISVTRGQLVYRCNLVTIQDGKMVDYSAGHITTAEAKELMSAIDEKLGGPDIHFFPGVSYRHILKLKHLKKLHPAECTPPHDITGRSIFRYMPKGKGGDYVKDMMKKSEEVLAEHPVNKTRIRRGQLPATSIWIFWPSGPIPTLVPFEKQYGVKAGMITGVDLLRGLAKMTKMRINKVRGVTDGLNNDYAAQGIGALKALEKEDLVFIHVEAPDEAGHSGLVDEKVAAIERTDAEIVRRLREYKDNELRLMILPDHPTPIDSKTHTSEPVPFLLQGPGIKSNKMHRLTEAEARASGFFIQAGYDNISKLIHA
jgi:2,3-bisphosphoglycerate-independent phosphoglycerate mutase